MYTFLLWGIVIQFIIFFEKVLHKKLAERNAYIKKSLNYFQRHSLRSKML